MYSYLDYKIFLTFLCHINPNDTPFNKYDFNNLLKISNSQFHSTRTKINIETTGKDKIRLFLTDA